MVRNFFKRNREAAVKQPHSPDWIIERRSLAKSLADSFAYILVEGEPLPPWMEYPEILIGSVGWRMGVGEGYIHEVFFPFWKNLTPEEQASYVKKFDLGPQWPDREKWLTSLERNKQRV